MTPELRQVLTDADQLNEETDALIARAKRLREQTNKVIYKDFMNAPLERSEPTKQSQYMDDATQKGWDDWLMAKLEDFADVIGGEIGSVIKEVREKQAARINQLETIITQLEGRVAALEGKGYQG
jgi:thymidylate synthase